MSRILLAIGTTFELELPPFTPVVVVVIVVVVVLPLVLVLLMGPPGPEQRLEPLLALGLWVLLLLTVSLG